MFIVLETYVMWSKNRYSFNSLRQSIHFFVRLFKKRPASGVSMSLGMLSPAMARLGV